MSLTDFQTKELVCGSERHIFKLLYHFDHIEAKQHQNIKKKILILI